MTKFRDLRERTLEGIGGHLREIILLSFLIIYLGLLVDRIDGFTPISDEAVHCLGGIVLHDFMKDFLRNPQVLLNIKQWVVDYNQRYEIGYAISFYGIFFYAMQMLMYQVFGISVASARATTVIFSIFNLIVVYLLGRRLYSENVGLIAAMLLASRPFYFYLSRQVMLGVPLSFTTNLAMLSLLLSSKNWSNRNLVLTGLLLGLPVITHVRSIVYIPLIFALYVIWNYGIAVMRSRTFWIPISICFLIFGLWFIPSVFVSSSLGRLSHLVGRSGAVGSKPWTTMLLDSFLNFLYLIWIRHDYTHLLGSTEILYNNFMAGLYVVGILYAVYLSYERRDENSRLIVSWIAGVYFGITGLLTFFSGSQAPLMHFERYLSGLYPSLALVTSNLLFTVYSFFRRSLSGKRLNAALPLVSLTGIVVILVLGVQQGVLIYNNWTTNTRLPYDEAVSFILADSVGEVTVLVDLWPPSFFIVVQDAERRVIIKTLQHLSLTDVEGYVQSLGYPDYVIIFRETFLKHRDAFESYYIARSYESMGSHVSDVLVLKLHA